jgi:epoxyqueuosine reductase
MQRHGLRRARPAELVPGTVSVISLSMNYLSAAQPEQWREQEWERLHDPKSAIVSVYARGRDYHKIMRQRLQKLAQRMQQSFGAIGYRVFVDSAPVLEVELATRAGLGWRGKHTLALRRDAGSMFFLGEIFVDCALPHDQANSIGQANFKFKPSTANSAQVLAVAQTSTQQTTQHCGSCTACISICPTQAIVAPYRLDARRCISYLTIEHQGSIAPELRPLIGNRIYGCDDCQLICPWNKYAKRSPLPDFDERHGLGSASLLELLQWSEDQFLQRTEGSAIRRIGFERWQRNLAVATGNALRAPDEVSDANLKAAMRQALQSWHDAATEMVREHIDWALEINQA